MLVAPRQTAILNKYYVLSKKVLARARHRMNQWSMIKNKLLLVALAASILLPAAVRADGISIQIGDRPFYNHGARYWAGDYEMVWVPGHSEGHHWIHGQYVRGERRHNGQYRNDDQQNDHRDNDRR
jgi:hypothetical protein